MLGPADPEGRTAFGNLASKLNIQNNIVAHQNCKCASSECCGDQKLKFKGELNHNPQICSNYLKPSLRNQKLKRVVKHNDSFGDSSRLFDD